MKVNVFVGKQVPAGVVLLVERQKGCLPIGDCCASVPERNLGNFAVISETF